LKQRDKQTAAASLARVDRELAEYEMEKIQKNECLENFRSFKGFAKIDKTIIDTLVYRIDITPLYNEVNITLNFRDSFEKLATLVTESGVMADVC
jgi:hypothetical protein